MIVRNSSFSMNAVC